MSKLYPVDTVQVMSDSVFVAYGGETGTSTPAMRNAAYYIAEESMCLHLGTLLTPTIVTGTVFPLTNGMTVLDWGYVSEVYQLRTHTEDGDTQMITDVSWALRDADNGFFDAGSALSKFLGWSCYPDYRPNFYSYDLAYKAGLQTGISMRPNMVMALTILSDIALKEMSVLGMNEGVGDIGIKSFSTAGYTESRVDLIRTALGSSARANYARKLVNGVKLTQALRMR